MQISENLAGYEKATLLLVLDRKHADFYLAEDRMVTELQKVTNELSNFENLGGERKGTVGHHGVDDENLRKKDTEDFFNMVASEVGEQDFSEMILIVKKDLETTFRSKLASGVDGKIVKVVSANLTKHSLPDIIEHIQK